MSSTYPLLLLIPKSTPIGAPVEVRVNCGLPVVTSGFITIPPGPAGLAFFRLLTRSTPIYPATSEWISGDDKQFPFSGYWRMDGPPWVVILQGYNLDDTFPHTITALVTVDSLQ